MGRSGINWGAEFPRFAVDLTGDGKADILGFGTNGVWVSLNDGNGNFSTPSFVPNGSSGQGQFGYGQAWRIEKHVRTLGNVADPSRARAVNVVSAMRLETASAPSALAAPIAPSVVARSIATSVAAPAGLARARGADILAGLARARGADIVGFGDDGVWVALSQGDGTFSTATLAVQNFGVNQSWQVGQHPRLLADISADGFLDIVGFGDAGVWIALSNGNGSFQVPRFVLQNFGVNQGWTVANHPRILADLTGDKRTDIVGFGNDGMWTALSNQDGGFQAAKFVIADFGYNQGWRTDVHERLLADLTGDGKADFIGFGNDGVWTALSRGDGTFTPAKMVVGDFCAIRGWQTTQHPRFVVDLTGNKQADLVGFGNDGVWTALGNGDGTFAVPKFVLQNFGVNQGWSVTNHPRFLADTTGDGLPDIVGFGDAGVWVAQNQGDGTFADARYVLNDFGYQSEQTGIKHIFVLMMENRSFDHLLGFSEIKGTDTQTGQPTSAEVLTRNESNSNGDDPAHPTYKVDQSAGDTTVRQHDVLHQFSDVTVQLSGTEHLQLDGAPYPAVDNSGFVTDYAAFGDKTNPGEPMRCFDPKYVPILNQLAKEFVLCDHWYSSMAGPTEPNRMFAHAATSGVWDDSPSGGDQLEDEALDSRGIHFDTGTIYDRLRSAKIPFRIFSGDGVPNVALLKGIELSDVDLFENFEKDVMDPGYEAAYTFIEPYYGTIDQYLNGLGSSVGDELEKAAIYALKQTLQEYGLLAAQQPINSQHPPCSVFEGESLIKKVYEIIRRSPHWNDSMLILAWDEHGGFYDHVLPPRAAPTGSKGKAHGFVFDQHGPRVPAVVISPLCPQGMIEHRSLEHSAIPATVEQVFGLQAMTVRDSSIVGVQKLATLQTPRQNTPLTLTPDSQRSRAPLPNIGGNEVRATVNPSTPLGSINDPWLTATIFIVAKGHMEAAATPEESTKIKVQVQGLKTIGDLMQYLNEAIPKVKTKQVEARQLRMAQTRSPVDVGFVR